MRVPTVPGGNSADNGQGGDAGSDAAFHAAVQDVFFGYDSYDISPEAESSVAAAAPSPKRKKLKVSL